MAELAATAAAALRDAGVELIFPAVGAARSSTPNRIVGLAGVGEGAAAAALAAAAVRARWQGWVRVVHGTVLATPGMPSVQWVVAAGTDADGGPVGYWQQWRTAQRELAGRKRVNDFSVMQAADGQLCSLSPRWAAVEPPQGLRDYEQDTLSAGNWVKRRWARLGAPAGAPALPGTFASTAAIATARYRQAVIDAMARDAELTGHVRALREAAGEPGRRLERPVPGLRWDAADAVQAWVARGAGSWVYASAWDPGRLEREHPGALWPAAVVAAGRAACKSIAGALQGAFPDGPPAYLALVMQDLDGMGRFLSGGPGGGEVRASWHAEVSLLLSAAAAEQRQALGSAELLASVVYSGGDDLLAMAPAATALTAARVGRDAVPRALPTASSAVLFFHYRSSLQRAVLAARGLLEDAKSFRVGKDALGVGFLRRSGVSEISVHPWNLGSSPASDLFALFGSAAERGFTPGVIGDLVGDRTELADLDASFPELYSAEITRLLRRHLRGRGDPGRVVDTVLSLTGGAAGSRHAAVIKTLTVAQFIGQECR